MRIPGAWDGFELGIRAILGQQISVRGASTLAGRLVAGFGRPLDSGSSGVTHVFPRAEDLAGANVASIGLPRKRADTLSAFSTAVASGHVVLDGSASLEEIREQLRSIPGIGEWTAEYVAMRALERPRCVSVRRSCIAAGLRNPHDTRTLEPFAALATLALLCGATFMAGSE